MNLTTETHRTRRRLLRTAGGLAAIGLAGCVSAPEADASQPTETDADDHTDDDHMDDAHADDDHHEPVVHHDDETPHGPEDAHNVDGPQPHVEVAMESTSQGEHFHPHVAWVEVGGTVTYVNESGAHTATAYHPDNDKPLRMPEGAESFDSGILTEAGATFEHTFEVEGVYDLYCAPHEQLGMIGSVVVGRPDPHDQLGLAEPQSDMSDAVATKLDMLNHQVDTMLGHEH